MLLCNLECLMAVPCPLLSSDAVMEQEFLLFFTELYLDSIRKSSVGCLSFRSFCLFPETGFHTLGELPACSAAAAAVGALVFLSR